MRLDRNKIYLQLARQGLSVSDLSVRYGVSRQRIHVILNSVSVSTKTAGRIAQALGVDVTEIIDMD